MRKFKTEWDKNLELTINRILKEQTKDYDLFSFSTKKQTDMGPANVEYVNKEEMPQLKEAVEQPRLMQITERLEKNNQELDLALGQIITKINMIDFRLFNDEEVAKPSPSKHDDISSFLTAVHSQLDRYGYLVTKINSIDRALRKLVG